MLYFPRWLVTLILGICALGVLLSLPNLFSQQTLDILPRWVPKKQVSLGLDLRGGSHLLLEVDMNAVRRERFNALVDSLRTEFRTARIGYTGGLNAEGDHVSFTLRDPQQLEDVRALVKKIDPEIDLTAGAGGEVTLKPNPVALERRTSSAVEQSIEIVRRRIDETGTKEPIIEREGQDRILVQLPGVEDPEHVKQLIGRTAKLTLRFVDAGVDVEDAKRGHLPPGDELLPLQDSRSPQGSMIVVQKRVMVSGDTLTDAQSTFDQNGAPVVSFTFDSTGTRRFAEATRANVGKLFAIVLDNKVISAPVIREPITQGHGQISGNFTTQSAEDLALLLRAGALPAPLTILEERTVGPGLGTDSIHAGSLASIVGVVLVVLFMIVFYGQFGIYADIALFFNLCLLLASLSLLGATLTLP
ncbi:MAG TPA: protein translocase subunit SecD, partial [Stellaceae bacterium]|nr:protein translocase subunit SecD [Stellaceae bacterium]